MSKTAIGAVAGVIILVAAVFIISGMRDKSNQLNLDQAKRQKASLFCSKCGAMELPVAEAVGLSKDATTGYLKCPKCGEYTLGAPTTCASCAATVISEPKSYQEPPEKRYEYLCPKCGKPVYKKSEPAPGM